MVVDAASFALIEFFLSVSLSFFLFLGIAYLVGRIGGEPRLSFLPMALILFCVAVIGGAAGFSGGMSRVGVVGEIVPAALSIVGGLSVYVFGVDMSKGATVGLAAACFALAMLTSYQTGANERGRTDEWQDARAKCVAAYSDSSIIGVPQPWRPLTRKWGRSVPPT